MDTGRTPKDPGTPWFQIATDHRDIDRHMRRAQEMRVEAMAEFLTSALRGIARLGRAAVAPLARRQRQQGTHDSLMGYTGRLLADAASRARTSR